MRSSRTDTPLVDALLDFCGKGARKLTPEALAASGGEVMSALTGVPVSEDLPACTALASWIVHAIDEQIAALNDPMEKGIAQVALAAPPDLHGKYVQERLAVFRSNGTFTTQQYYDHRRRVVRVITAGLRANYHARNAKGGHPLADCRTSPAILRTARVPNIFLAGYYCGSSLDPVATALGAALVQQPASVNLSSMASRAGLLTGYAMATESEIMNTYTPERYTLFRRTGSRRRQPISRCLGRTECLPGSLNEARLSILGRSDIVIAFAGDGGTAHELRLADQLGIPVVPIAATGGAARDRWYADGAAKVEIDPTIAAMYHDLANPDMTIAVHAAARIVTHLLLEGSE